MKLNITSKDEVRFVKSKKNKDNKYKVDFTINNKRKSRIFSSKSDADNFIKDLNTFIKGKRIVNTNTGPQIQLGRCFYEMNEYNLENESITTSSYRTYELWFRNSFPDDIKIMDIHNITKETIKKIRLHCSYDKNGNKLTGSKFKSALNILKKIHEYSIYKRYKTFDVDLKSINFTATQIEKNKVITKEKFLEITDLFFETKKDTEKIRYAFCIFIIQTGLRVGEAAVLKAQDFNMKEMELTVSKTSSKDKDGNSIVSETTKTKKVRKIDVFEIGPIIKYLTRFNDDKFIFRTKQSRGEKFLTNSTFNKWVKWVLKRIDYESSGTHTIGRKSMCTISAIDLMEDHSPIEAAKKIQLKAGHSNLSTTLDNYVQPLAIPKERMRKIFEIQRKEDD